MACRAPLTREVWDEARAAGYRYCGIVRDNVIDDGILVAVAAVWRYAETAREVAAVATQPTRRRRGYGEAVVAFATEHILRHRHVATLHTAVTNHAMRRCAASVGFVEETPWG